MFSFRNLDAFGSPQPWTVSKVHVIYAWSGKLDSTLSIVIG